MNYSVSYVVKNSARHNSMSSYGNKMLDCLLSRSQWLIEL